VRGPDGRDPLTGVVEIAADGRTELALLRDGTVMSWGANTYGMLGDGTKTDRSLPVQVRSSSGAEPLRGVRHVAVGGQHGVALLSTGEVLTWGHNDCGQLGDGTTIDRSLPGHVRGLDGEQTLSGVVAVAAAEKHLFALRSDQTVVGWGNNTAGQLGDSTTEPRSMPVRVVNSGSGPELRGVRGLAAGEAYGVALLDDGTVRTWGAGGRGQLGSGDRLPRRRPGPVIGRGGTLIEDVLAIGAGERHLILLVSSARR
jgi:alpha-tubulin suppressor-like RCC1 family protein